MTTMTPSQVQQELQPTAENAAPVAAPGAPTYRRGQLGEQIAAARDEMQNLKKTGYNRHDGYHYYTASDLNEAARQALKSRGISIIPRIQSDTLQVHRAQNDQGKTKIHVWGVWEFEVTNGIESFIGSEPGYGLNHDDKAMRQASVMAQKGFLQNLLLINDSDDAEATDTEGNSTRQAPPQQASQPAAQNTGNAGGAGNEPTWPFGKEKGKLLSDVSDNSLNWGLENSFDPDDPKYGDRNAKMRALIMDELERRQGGGAAPGEHDDDIPF